MFPDAPIYTSVFDPAGLPEELREWPIRTTFLQRLPVPTRFSRAMLPAMPYAFRALDLSDFDTVHSISSDLQRVFEERHRRNR
jgi:hypothetical protein